MTSTTRPLLTASTATFVLAAMLSVTLHECAHAVAGLVQGLGVTLSTNSVSYDGAPSEHQATLAAAAGPLWSLVLGLVLYAVGRDRGPGHVRLLVLWVSLMSMANVAGYLLIAPFARAGDTGKVLDLLGAPAFVYVVSCALGVVGTLAVSRTLATQVVRYAHTPEEMRAMVIFPWLIGTGLVVSLTLLQSPFQDLEPDQTFLVLLAAVAIGIFAPMFSFFYGSMTIGDEHLQLGSSRPWIVATAAVAVLLTALAVVGGLHLG